MVLDNVTTTIHRLETNIDSITKQIANTDINDEDFHTSTNTTVTKLSASVNFVETQLLKTHTTIQTTVWIFEQRTLDRISDSVSEVVIVINKSEQQTIKLNRETKPLSPIAVQTPIVLAMPMPSQNPRKNCYTQY